MKVATIEIELQTDIDTRDDEAERMSFTPWRALPEHQPLGGISRARLAIYREMSRYRNELNQPHVSRHPDLVPPRHVLNTST